MIDCKIDVEEYCQHCRDFDAVMNNTSWIVGADRMNTNIIITCKNIDICRRLQKRLEKEKKE